MSSSTLSSRLLSGMALALALALVGCGGGGGGAAGSGSFVPPGGSSANGTDCTQPTSADVDGCTYVSLSDDTGDFLTYRVNVTKITLTRRDGTVVSLIPASASVDFAQFTSLSEFLSLNAVPAGDYTSGVISLDFTGADIEAQDSSGNAISLNPVDTSGAPLGAVDVTITFDGNHPLSLFPGAAHVLGINFDLNASNVINSGSHTVTVQPFLVAQIDNSSVTTSQVHGTPSAIASTTLQQVRGTLSAVASNTITLDLHPFQASSKFAKVVVYATVSTGFVVNQQVSSGTAGLAALQAANSGTAVVAQGNFDFSSGHFIATLVLAGSSAPGGSGDAVDGVVTARSGNTLTVRGGNLYRSSGSLSFSDTATVDVGTSTAVQEVDNVGTALGIANISVGQHILAFGSLSNATTLDATAGLVLLRYTAVDGSVVSLVNAATNSSATLNLSQIEDRPVTMFNFTGTGSNPSNYLIDLPCSCLNSGVNVGDPVTILGFPAAFGTAPPDFNGQALTDFGLGGTVMSFVWSVPTASAFSSIDASSGVVANASSSPATATLREGGQVTNLSGGTVPAVVGKSLGIFAISKGGTVHLYLTFSDFISALHSDLSGGATVGGFFAVGGYDAADHLLNATTVSVILH